MTPMKAIRAKCLDCMCGSYAEVKLCPCDNCPLYPYRFGKRPQAGKDTPSLTNNPNPPANSLLTSADTKGD